MTGACGGAGDADAVGAALELAAPEGAVAAPESAPAFAPFVSSQPVATNAVAITHTQLRMPHIYALPQPPGDSVVRGGRLRLPTHG